MYYMVNLRGHYKYILTIMDPTTRYHEAFPLKNITSRTIISKLTTFFTTFGIPQEIQSDRGTNFTSDLFKAVTTALGITQTLSTAYHPQSQGALERCHQTLKSLLRTKTGRTSWWSRGNEWPWLLQASSSYKKIISHGFGLHPRCYAETPSGTILFLGPRKALCLTLWYLGTQSTYREISELFGVSMTTVHECVQRIIDVLCRAGQKVIVWPAAERIPQISHEFQSLGRIPGVIGAVDECHINIKAPNETQADYIDRNQRHSINLMSLYRW